MADKVAYVLVLMTLLCTAGCSSDEPTIEYISKIEVFDVGNAGDASDIRVRFSVETIAGVDEFRIMIYP